MQSISSAEFAQLSISQASSPLVAEPKAGRLPFSEVKTNATRQLDKLGIRYELKIFLAPQDYIRATGAKLGALTR